MNLGRLFSVIFLVILARTVKSTHIGFKCTEGADPRVYSGRGGRCLFRNHPPPLSRFDTHLQARSLGTCETKIAARQGMCLISTNLLPTYPFPKPRFCPK